jgi:hypothetical protein
MRKIIITFILIIQVVAAAGQKRLLDNPVILPEVKKCLYYTYNFDFQNAKKMLAEIEDYTSDHPAVSFLKSFILYWEYYPIVPGHPREKEFVSLLEQCIRESEEWVKRDRQELEAIFFDLFSRAFYVMFWADNGKPGKVFPHINLLYQHTMEGFDLKEKFNEFYFTSGLYNYYIIAYPEKHPVYKPVVVFFKEGDMPKGLEQLQYCAENAVFLRVEAKFFLSLLYLNYEKDLTVASEYAADLYREFPENSFYTGKYLEVLLYNRKYFFAPVLLSKLKNWDTPFSQMQYHLYSGYLLEKSEKNLEAAKKEYEKALEISEQFGDFTDGYNAIAWMGLSRYYGKKGDSSLSNRYFRQAKDATSYEFILEDR